MRHNPSVARALPADTASGYSTAGPDSYPWQVAAAAVLDAYHEGRPLRELFTHLPEELEATGQTMAAAIVRMLFERPALEVLSELQATL